MRILNLYAGLGGNRRLWEGVDVTAVELRPEIAIEYSKLYPNDEMVVGDAHLYLEKHWDEFDFVWSSPPCQSHSRAAAKGHQQTARYPDMKLYQEIIFLKTHFEGKWVVENVQPYYEPLIASQKIGRHLFWANFHIEAESVHLPVQKATREDFADWLGFDYEGSIYYDGNHCPAQVLRNCVHPDLGLAVLNSAKGEKQENITQQSLGL